MSVLGSCILEIFGRPALHPVIVIIEEPYKFLIEFTYRYHMLFNE